MPLGIFRLVEETNQQSSMENADSVAAKGQEYDSLGILECDPNLF